jgi:transcription initiation factor IIE alpha subunit
MISESRHFIDLKEILGIEYDCPKCHVRVYYDLDTVPIHQAFMCNGCRSAVIDESDSQYMEQLVKTIRHLQSRGDKLSAFRLQIAGETR